MVEFARNLKYLRKQAGLTQEMMAERLMISCNQYKNYEQGKSYPSVEKFFLLGKVLNVPLDYFAHNENRLYENYASSALFKDLMDMDEDQAKAIFYVFEKLKENISNIK